MTQVFKDNLGRLTERHEYSSVLDAFRTEMK